MKKSKKPSKSTESGQYLELFIILFLVLLAFAAFAIDGGRVLVEKRRIQNAADNAALSTAAAYCQNHPFPEDVGYAVAYENFADSDETTYVVSIYIPPIHGETAGHEGHVEVVVNATIASTFANIVNISSFSTSARAVGYCERGGGKAIFAGADDCGSGGKTIDWSGSGISVEGGIHSNDNFYVGGSSNVVNGIATLVELGQPPSFYPSSNVTFNPASSNPAQGFSTEYPVDFNYHDFAPGGSEANAAGVNYHSCNCKMDLGWLESHGLYNSSTHVLTDGLYYTPGDIELSAGPMYGDRVTFVAGGEITFGGSDQEFGPFTNGLLAFSYNDLPSNQCTTPLVKFSGGSNTWAGIIYAPHGLIEMSGSNSSTYDGGLIGWSVRINGSDVSITYNPSYFSPLISMME